MFLDFVLMLVAIFGILGYCGMAKKVRALEMRFDILERLMVSLPKPDKAFAPNNAPAEQASVEKTPSSEDSFFPISQASRLPSSDYRAEAAARARSGFDEFGHAAPLDALPVSEVDAALAAHVAPTPGAMPERPTPRPAPAPAVPTAWAHATDTLMGLVRKNPFASLGVMLMLVGVGFLFAWLAASNILPPALRVALLATAGIGVFAAGIHQEKPRYALAMNLQGGALALEFLCALWAYHGYELITPTAAFVWMGALSTVSIGWAMFKRRALFAFMGLAGSLLTPIFASTGHGEFSSLVMYCAWVSALAIGAGVYLRVPALVSTAIAGVSALLGAALGIRHGSALLSGVGLIAMSAAYSAVAVTWTSKAFDWAKRQQASVVSVLMGAPLVMAGFLYGRADLTAKSCAIGLGVTAAVYVLRSFVASDTWKAGLFCIGAGMGLVAIGVGLDGAGRVLALSAASMGLIMIARSMTAPWVRIGALVYWGFAVGMGFDALVSGNSLSAMPLGISGLVALAAGYSAKGSRLGVLYTLSAPLILCTATLWGHPANAPFVATIWFCAWAALSYAAGRALRWPELRMSAAWLFIAGAEFVPNSVSGQDVASLVRREVILLTWALEIAALVWLFHKDVLLRQAARLLSGNQEELTHVEQTAERSNLSWATLALPAIASTEVIRMMDAFGRENTAILGTLLALWAVWHLLSRLFAKKSGFEGQAKASAQAATLLLLLNVLTAQPGFGWLAVQWAALAALAFGAYRLPLTNYRQELQVTAGAGGIALLGTLLRGIGSTYGHNLNVLNLLITRDMQPWISVLWAAAGITVVALASQRSNRKMWVGGGIAVLVLIAKMLLIDLSTFTLPAKVAVFMVTGLAFVALGYFCPLPPGEASEPDDGEVGNPG